LLLCCLQLATAQSLIDVNVGFGAAHDKAATTGLDLDPSGTTLVSCSQKTDSTCSPPTSGLGGFFMGFGANLMLWKHFGAGVDVTLQPGKPTYAQLPAYYVNLKSRETFYDFNGIYQPVSTKKATLQLIGGIGGANTKYYTSSSAAGQITSTPATPYGSANHFQIHAGVGVQIYLTDHVYVRPQFDLHYVPNFTQQYGSTAVIQGMVWLGYTIGDRQ
jgi:hypothetical protein